MKTIKYAGIIICTAVIVMAVVVLSADTIVAFKVQDSTLYRQIKNGRIGANCFDENGVKIIAPSRFVGKDWVPIASMKDIPASGKTYGITCYPYASISDAPSVDVAISLAGAK